MRGCQFNKVEMSRFAAAGQAEGAPTEFVGCTQGLVEKLAPHCQTTLLGWLAVGAVLLALGWFKHSRGRQQVTPAGTGAEAPDHSPASP